MSDGARVAPARRGRGTEAPAARRRPDHQGEWDGRRGGELTIVEQVAAPGAASALHRHPYQEVFYVLEGELEFAGLENGERVTFAVGRPARTVHAAAGVAHGYRNDGPSPPASSPIMQPAGAEGFFDGGRCVARRGRATRRRTPPAPSPDAVLEAAARHGIEFLPAPVAVRIRAAL